MDLQWEISYFDPNGNALFSNTRESGWHRTDNRYFHPELGLEFQAEFSTGFSGSEQLTVRTDSICENLANRFRTLTPLGETILGYEGETGTLLLPYGSGLLCHTRGKEPAEYLLSIFSERKWQATWGNMALWGYFSGGRASLAIIEGGKFETDLRLRTNWGRNHEYRLDPVISLREIPDEALLNENITICFATIPGDWKAIAHFYRSYNLTVRKLPRLVDKIENNPAIAYSIGALTVRCRMCVKPLPPKIYEQRPENEPTPRIFMKFNDVTTIAREFRRQNVGPVEFNLVGWNHGGHDGAFPQLFPAAKVCGGNSALNQTTKDISHLGYAVSLHDNYNDGYTLANNFNFDDVCHSTGEYGGPVVGGGRLGGGQGYRICAEKAIGYAERNFTEIKQRLPEISGAYYVDVLSIIPMKKCYHPGHPLDRRGNADAYKKIIGMQHHEFGVAMSEGARDWAFPELDRAYMVYNNFDTGYPFVDQHVPMFQMVYHGFFLYNNSRSGVNAWPGSTDYIFNYAWGGVPIVYFHHLFNPAWSSAGGWSRDLTFETQEKLTRDTTVIRKMSDDVVRFAPLQTEFLDDVVHHSATLIESCFSGGKRLWTNLSDKEVVTPNGQKVAQFDFEIQNE